MKPEPRRVSVVIGLLLSSACGPSSHPLRFAWIPKELNNPVFETGRDGALLKAMELTQAGPVSVEVLYMAPDHVDGALQTQVLMQAIAAKVDGIAISVVDDTLAGPVIDQAVDSGIPIMTFDSDAASSKRFTLYSLNNIQSGITGAQVLGKVMGEKGTLAIMTSTAPNLVERTNSFKQEITANHPNMMVIDSIDCPNEDKMVCGGLVENETTQKHPGGWFYPGSWPLFLPPGSLPNWEAASTPNPQDALASTKNVAFDTIPVCLALVQKGYVQALIGQKYWGWGYDSTQILYDKVHNHKTFDSFTDSGTDIVCKDNYQDMQAKWDSHQFNTPLPPCTSLGF
jgi:ribose transport system substrate-binding protein